MRSSFRIVLQHCTRWILHCLPSKLPFLNVESVPMCANKKWLDFKSTEILVKRKKMVSAAVWMTLQEISLDDPWRVKSQLRWRVQLQKKIKLQAILFHSPIKTTTIYSNYNYYMLFSLQIFGSAQSHSWLKYTLEWPIITSDNILQIYSNIACVR